VALAILGISMVGILDVMVMAMQQNLENYCRDEAVRIAEEEMNKVRNMSYTEASNPPPDYDVTRTYKQFTRKFTVHKEAPQFSPNSISLLVRVKWTIVKTPHYHSITSIRSQGV
jgi:Tfp pilus assembly protein PilV